MGEGASPERNRSAVRECWAAGNDALKTRGSLSLARSLRHNAPLSTLTGPRLSPCALIRLLRLKATRSSHRFGNSVGTR